MPRKPCYWTRKLELDLVEFVREREFIWKPIGNTNHHIEQKYKAYAEFAAQVGGGFTARSVRDRWINIRSTFNHNLRRLDKSKETARSPEDIYVPCWPLWKPLQFLRENASILQEPKNDYSDAVGMDTQNNIELNIRERIGRTDRPRRKSLQDNTDHKQNTKCVKVIDELLRAMEPLVKNASDDGIAEPFWFFGMHVTERLNAMRERDADCASHEIFEVLKQLSHETT